MQFFKEYSYKRGAALSIGSTFIWKIISFINSILIAYYFGTQTNSDIYFYILYIVGFMVSLSSYLNTNILIPQAIYLRKENEQSAKSLLNFFLLFYIICLFIIFGITFLFPVKCFAIISHFPIEILQQNIVILRFALLYLCTYVLCYFILDIMYIYHIFSINFLFPLNALIPMFIMIFFHNTLGLTTMLIGFSLSYLLQIIVGLFIMKKKLKWSFTSFSFYLENRLKNNIIINQILTFIDCFISLLPIYLLSNFAGGIISALSYAKQLTDAPSEIITSKITKIYHIQLNENASARDFEALNKNSLKVNYFLLFILTPIVLFTCYFAQDIIYLFFKRGKFDTQSSINVIRFLRPLMILILINLLCPLANSLIASTRKIKESFKYMLTKAIIFIFSMFFFIPHFGPFAYPYIEIGCAIFQYLLLALFFKRHIPQIHFWQPLKDACLLVSLNCLALIPAILIGHFLKGQIALIKLFICGIVFLSVLALLYLPTGQLKKILSSSLGSRYKSFLLKIPFQLKRFFL